MQKRVVLIIGPKHSGKSLCAQALKKILGWDTVDLDKLIEAQSGKTPRELFLEGQKFFQKAETTAMASLVKRDCLIIAAGGGFIDNSDAIKIISETKSRRGIVSVCLDISAETAWQRITKAAVNGALPPFLNTENPGETHLALHNRRKEAYRAMADIIISAENKSPEDIALEIAVQLPGHWAK